MSKVFRAMLLGLIATQCFVVLEGAQAKAKSKPKAIKVITITEDGRRVNARIKIKAYPESEKEAYILGEEDGYAKIAVDKCDSFVMIMAESETIGIVRKAEDLVPDWLPCKEPEVTFNDFLIEPMMFSTSNPAYKTEGFWRKTLGDVAVNSNPNLAKDIADAFSNQEYGKISIITTELEKTLRTAGKKDEADFLYSLAVDAGARGVLQSGGIISDVATANVLEYSKDTGRFELRADVKVFVEQYQAKTFDYSPYSQQMGKFNWETMKSLPGGDVTFAPDYQIGGDAAMQFDGTQLQGLQGYNGMQMQKF
jgi:hypothetical protein